MGITIEDGKGSGICAEITEDNRLRTMTVANSLTNHIASSMHQNVYSVIGTATVVAGTVVPLFIQNNDPSLELIIDRVLIQGASISGGTAIPNNVAYFSLGYGRTFSAGGADVTPVNTNKTSTKVANVIAKGTNPTLAGTFAESHRWYIEGNGKAFELVNVRTDDIILGRSNTLEIRYTSDNIAGTVLAFVKFIMATEQHFG